MKVVESNLTLLHSISWLSRDSTLLHSIRGKIDFAALDKPVESKLDFCCTRCYVHQLGWSAGSFMEGLRGDLQARDGKKMKRKKDEASL